MKFLKFNYLLLLLNLNAHNFFYCEQLQVGISREENGYKLWQSLVRQTDLIAQLCSITKDVRNVRGGTQKKIDKLRHLLTGLLSELTYFDEVLLPLAEFGWLYIYGIFIRHAFLICIWVASTLCQPIRSPLAPGTLITGIVPAESSIFKSALHPLRLTFRTLSGETCKVIFKKGDDLRQDQLVGFLFFGSIKIEFCTSYCLVFYDIILILWQSLPCTKMHVV